MNFPRDMVGVTATEKTSIQQFMSELSDENNFQNVCLDYHSIMFKLGRHGLKTRGSHD